MSQNTSRFTLNDVIYLDQSYIKRLQRVGIVSLQDVTSCDAIDLVHELNIAQRSAELILYHSRLLQRGRIPVSKLPSSSEIVWISSQNNHTSRIVHLSQNGKISKFSGIVSETVSQVVEETHPIVIGNQLDYLGHFNYWTNYLTRNVFNAVNTSHDYLFSTLTGRAHRTYAALVKSEYESQYSSRTSIDMELVTKVLSEVNFMLNNLIQVKQDFKSLTVSSSVNRTANKPPKL